MSDYFCTFVNKIKKMNRYILVILACLTCLPMALSAQEEETVLTFGLGATVEKELPKGFDVAFSYEMEMNKHLSRAEQYALGLQGGYALKPWLHASAGYQYFRMRTDDEQLPGLTYWEDLHKTFAGIEASVDVNHFTFTVNEQYQWFTPTVFHLLGLGLAVEYSIPRTPLSIGASADVLNDLRQSLHCLQTTYRATLNCDIDEHHALTLTYVFNRHSFLDSNRGHIVQLAYTFSF